MRVRRRNPCLIQIDDVLALDLGALLRGRSELAADTAACLLCPISGQRIRIPDTELRVIAGLTSDRWHLATEVAATHAVPVSVIEDMAARGLVCSDSNEIPAKALRQAEDRLHAVGWHPQAAVLEALSRWRSVEGEEGAREHGDLAQLERLRSQEAAYGVIPPHFHIHRDASSQLKLVHQPLDGPLGEVLTRRRTSRHLRTDTPLPLAEFSRVLGGTFGATGTETLAPGMVAVKRTSPSGGALHPIDAYPLVVDVAGVAPGFYHYQSRDNSLALIRPMTPEEARRQASALTAGQTYFGNASTLVFHVARLDRHHWKYRRHPKAYKAVLLDSGHLSQTFYLLATERSLGVFFTAAMNDGDVLDLLGLDPLCEMVIGANGLGLVDTTDDRLDLHPSPYSPDAGREPVA